MEEIIDILTNSLQGIAWKLAGVMIVASILGMVYKTMENKLLSWAEQKIRERKAKKTQHDQWTGDWVTDANARQNNRYEYMDPAQPPQYIYNEKSRMWVDREQLEQEQHRKAYEENRRKWKEYEEEEIRREREREEARRINKEIERHQQAVMEEMRRPIILTPEEQELAKQIRIKRNGPTFEEWKAEKLRQQQQNSEHPKE